jgi:hypothetical protein
MNSRTHKAISLASLALAMLVVCAAARADQPVPATVDDMPVVVELFTSQGCSSCPPADTYLGKLADRHDILPLAFHVNYWDYIGWKDPFASNIATERQYSYGHALGLNMVYTPQMVVGGTHDAVGSDENAVSRAIEMDASRPKLKLTVVRETSGAYRVEIPAGPAGNAATVWLALFDHAHKTPVARGENSGTTLVEYNIVREWRKIGDWNGQAKQIALNLTPESDEYDACAVIVQEGGYGVIRGAASFRMEKP